VAELVDALGVGLGSFFVIDYKPRHWSVEDRSTLGDLAARALSEWKAVGTREFRRVVDR
jgi:hypothetical protein